MENNKIQTNIVQEFDKFLQYVEANKVKLTKKREQLSRKDLVSVYGLMEEPKLTVPEKANQPSYPLIHLFFHLALTLDLIVKKGSTSDMQFTAQSDRISSFRKLNRSEQYVTLLDAFWQKADWEELQGGSNGRAPHNVDFVFEELERFQPNKKIKVSEITRDLYSYEHFLFYFSYFGLWEVIFDKDRSNQPELALHYEAEAIILTPLFKDIVDALIETWEAKGGKMHSFLDLLVKTYDNFLDEEDMEQKDENNTESLFQMLKPYFPKGEIENTLSNKEQVFQDGKFLFKVSLNKSCWRTIQLSGKHKLSDLHNLIQEAFEFDDDHLYAFFMDGERFSRNAYHSPMESQGPYVHHARLGSLQLYEGKRFSYLFDYGDEWLFFIDVMEISEGMQEVSPAIIESKGESPEQYVW